MEEIVIGSSERKGQDCSATFVNTVADIRGIILSDGLGSCCHARETAEFIVATTKVDLESLPELNCAALNGVFLGVHRQLWDWIHKEDNHGGNVETTLDGYGATLIVVVETKSSFLIAYVGNGAIWHIRGNAFVNHGVRLLPWSVSNLLNPHTIPENGVEALYKYFSASPNPALVSPTVLELSKDVHYGDVLFVCTDGISSNDQVSVGQVESGVWSHVESPLLQFISLLRVFLTGPLASSSLDNLRDAYQTWLHCAREVEDDASFGILLSLPNLRQS